MTTRDVDTVARLRAMVDALPPERCEVEAYPYVGDVPEEIAAWLPALATVETSDGHMMSQPTAETIAALRNLAPELLAVVEAARPWDTPVRCAPGCDCAPCRLGDALAALDGAS